MPKGYIRIQVMSNTCLKPLKCAIVRIYKCCKGIEREYFLTCDESGKSSFIGLECDESPYHLYQIEVKYNHYKTLQLINVQIYENQYIEIEVYLSINDSSLNQTIIIPKHRLLMKEKLLNTYITPIKKYDRIRIPKNIIVHTEKDDIEINYIQYIKQIACLNIYPNENKEAILAYLYCLLSQTLNEIYKGMYRKQGYFYDVVSNVNVNPNYVIHNVITEYVDDIFNKYIKLEETYLNDLNYPFSISILDIIKLSDLGMNHIQILEYFMGNHMHIVTTNDIETIEDTFSGRILKMGCNNRDVLTIQKKLNLIMDRKIKEDGIYGYEMQQIVSLFQYIYSLKEDGIIGKKTWYKILFINERCKRDMDADKIIVNKDMFQIQKSLNIISSILSCLDIVIVDGIYGENTKANIIYFARFIGMEFDGTLNEEIINKILDVAQNIKQGEREFPIYKKEEAKNQDDLCDKLNYIALSYPIIPIVYKKELLINSIMIFQNMLGIKGNGIIDEKCLYLIYVMYEQLR